MTNISVLKCMQQRLDGSERHTYNNESKMSNYLTPGLLRMSFSERGLPPIYIKNS